MNSMKVHKEKEQVWDVAVIGGGPSGMMAAGRAAEKGARVVLIEKNKTLGKKLLITGGGRCNVTNSEFDNKKLLAKFKGSGKFLSSTFSQWSVQQTLDFFHKRGMPTKIEGEKRVFPLSNTAQSVWNTLVEYIKQNNVTVISSAPVIKLHSNDNKITSAEIEDGQIIRARSFILATGGTSHPETGSTGDGYLWLRTLGHSISNPECALVPVAVKEKAKIARTDGVAVPNAKITLFQNEVKQTQQRGKILFTHIGLSGPCILNMSREIGELLKYGDVVIEIDLLPNMGYEKVNATLQTTFKEHNNKKIKNALQIILSPALIPMILDTAQIDPETFCHSISRDARIRLMKTLKHCRFGVAHLLGANKAVITSGGVSLTEVDLKTMRSLKCKNLFLIGDMLDIDRPSGGYSLQLCWTTGFVAGNCAVD